MRRLSEATLPEVPDDIVVPQYPRHVAEQHIVHIGLGNFHRAHQAWYLDALRASGDLRWGMRGAGVLDADAPLLQALGEQDGLYCLTEKATSGTVTRRVIGAVAEVLPAGDSERLAAWLADPTTGIVTLTITEGGYLLDPLTGRFDAASSEPALDAARSTPSSTFGHLARALAARRAAGTPPFTVLSCDNLLDNGRAAREAVVAFAAALDPDLGDWVDREVAFPCSMVDGITPTATASDRDEASAALGVRDACTVTCEPFRQWVIEDHFPLGRPDWAAVGAELVADVAPYEQMKLRLLNAAHQVLAHAGVLAGHTHIHDAINDPALGGVLEAFWAQEARPTIDAPPGVDLTAYCAVLRERFANPGIADTVERNAAFTSDRFPAFVLPTIQANLAGGGSVRFGAFALACWAHRLLGRDGLGVAHDIVDDRRDELLALVADGDPLGLLDHPVLASVGSDPRLREAVAEASSRIATDGVRAAAASLLKGTP